MTAKRRVWMLTTSTLCVGFSILLFGLSSAAPSQTVAGRSLDRVLRPNELAGFVPAQVQTIKDVNAWAKIAPGALVNVAARLRSEGFVAGVREDLSAHTMDRGALSIVVQLRTSGAAKKELGLQRRDYANEGHHLPGSSSSFFSVSTIPSAYGFTGTDPGGGTGVNVIFADGRFSTTSEPVGAREPTTLRRSNK